MFFHRWLRFLRSLRMSCKKKKFLMQWTVLIFFLTFQGRELLESGAALSPCTETLCKSALLFAAFFQTSSQQPRDLSRPFHAWWFRHVCTRVCVRAGAKPVLVGHVAYPELGSLQSWMMLLLIKMAQSWVALVIRKSHFGVTTSHAVFQLGGFPWLLH